MTLTTAQAFDKFMEDISITPYQRTSIVEGRREAIKTNLASAFPETSDLPLVDVYKMGSAAKGTIVRPIDDVDVLAVFSNAGYAWQNKYAHDSQAFLYRVRKVYDGFEVAQVGARGQAVRVFFQTGGHVDIAPVFIQSEGVYHLPSGNGGWMLTAPFKANNWFLEKNRDLSYNLAPLVRLLKKWNEAHSRNLRSFHLETMAASCFKTLPSNRRTGLQKFFEWGGNHLHVSDPGGQSGPLSQNLTYSREQEIRQSLSVASERALRAIESEGRGDHAEARRLWRIILGAAFPV